jgi:predicted metal-dependent phosphotriesterase family hydrolase
MIKRLVDAGFVDKIFLASDWMLGLTLSPTGTFDVLHERNPSGNLFNIRNTIPHLRRLGMSEQQIRTITVLNPAAFFARL